MADPTEFPQQNRVLRGPPDSGISDLPAHVDEAANVVTSCWKLTQEEIEHVNVHGVIWVQTLGYPPPPVKASGTFPLIEIPPIARRL